MLASNRRWWNYLQIMLSVLFVQPVYFLLYLLVFCLHLPLYVFSLSRINLILMWNKFFKDSLFRGSDSCFAPAIFWPHNDDKVTIFDKFVVPVSSLLDLGLTIISVGFSAFLAIIYATHYGWVYVGVNLPALLFGAFKIIVATVRAMRDTYEILKSEKDVEYRDRVISRIADVGNVWGDWLTAVLGKVVSLSLVLVNLFNILAYLGIDQATAALLSAVAPVVTLFAQSVAIAGTLVLLIIWVIRGVVNNSLERDRFRQEKDALKQEIKSFAGDSENINKLRMALGAQYRDNPLLNTIVELLTALSINPVNAEVKRNRRTEDFRAVVLADKLIRLTQASRDYLGGDKIHGDIQSLITQIQDKADTLLKKMDTTIAGRNAVVLHSRKCELEVTKRIRMLSQNLLVGLCLIGANALKICNYLNILTSLISNPLFLSIVSVGGLALPIVLGVLVANFIEQTMLLVNKGSDEKSDISDEATTEDVAQGLFSKLCYAVRNFDKKHDGLCRKLLDGFVSIIVFMIFAHNLLNPVMLIGALACIVAFTLWTCFGSLVFNPQVKRADDNYNNDRVKLQPELAQLSGSVILPDLDLPSEMVLPSLAYRTVHKNKGSFALPGEGQAQRRYTLYGWDNAAPGPVNHHLAL